MPTLDELADPEQVRRLRELTSSAEPSSGPEQDDDDVETKGTGDPMQIEHKSDPTTAIIGTNDSTGEVTAIVSVTGVEDRVQDIIEPGAYTKTLLQREPIGVWSHDDKTWVARADEARELFPGDPFFSTPEFVASLNGKSWPKEAGGLLVKARFNLDTPHGKAAYSDVKFFEGKSSWSIGYKVTKATRNPRSGVRSIKELDLYEFSPVMVGANQHAMTLSVKSLAQPVDPNATPELDSSTEDITALLAARQDFEVKKGMPDFIKEKIEKREGDDDDSPKNKPHAFVGKGLCSKCMKPESAPVHKKAAAEGKKADVGPHEYKTDGGLRCVEQGCNRMEQHFLHVKAEPAVELDDDQLDFAEGLWLDEVKAALDELDEVYAEDVEEKGSSASLNVSPRKNWVENSGDLPRYIREVARSIHQKRGIPLDRAIPIAIGTIKRWARGGGDVNADTRAKAAAAVAAWEALKAKNAARMGKKSDLPVETKSIAELAAEIEARRALFGPDEEKRKSRKGQGVGRDGDGDGIFNEGTRKGARRTINNQGKKIIQFDDDGSELQPGERRTMRQMPDGSAKKIIERDEAVHNAAMQKQDAAGDSSGDGPLRNEDGEPIRRKNPPAAERALTTAAARRAAADNEKDEQKAAVLRMEADVLERFAAELDERDAEAFESGELPPESFHGGRPKGIKGFLSRHEDKVHKLKHGEKEALIGVVAVEATAIFSYMQHYDKPTTVALAVGAHMGVAALVALKPERLPKLFGRGGKLDEKSDGVKLPDFAEVTAMVSERIDALAATESTLDDEAYDDLMNDVLAELADKHPLSKPEKKADEGIFADDVEMELKAGRALSGANAARILKAYEELGALLTSAGLLDATPGPAEEKSDGVTCPVCQTVAFDAACPNCGFAVKGVRSFVESMVKRDREGQFAPKGGGMRGGGSNGGGRGASAGSPDELHAISKQANADLAALKRQDTSGMSGRERRKHEQDVEAADRRAFTARGAYLASNRQADYAENAAEGRAAAGGDGGSKWSAADMRPLYDDPVIDDAKLDELIAKSDPQDAADLEAVRALPPNKRFGRVRVMQNARAGMDRSGRSLKAAIDLFTPETSEDFEIKSLLARHEELRSVLSEPPPFG